MVNGWTGGGRSNSLSIETYRLTNHCSH
jgi:hypothetical protein